MMYSVRYYSILHLLWTELKRWLETHLYGLFGTYTASLYIRERDYYCG